MATTFRNKAHGVRVELQHQPIAGCGVVCWACRPRSANSVPWVACALASFFEGVQANTAHGINKALARFRIVTVRSEHGFQYIGYFSSSRENDGPITLPAWLSPDSVDRPSHPA